jgi:hypothetical protein
VEGLCVTLVGPGYLPVGGSREIKMCENSFG